MSCECIIMEKLLRESILLSDFITCVWKLHTKTEQGMFYEALEMNTIGDFWLAFSDVILDL